MTTWMLYVVSWTNYANTLYNTLNMHCIPPLQAEPASSPVAPVPPRSTDVLGSSDGAYKFKIDGGKNSFL